MKFMDYLRKNLKSLPYWDFPSKNIGYLSSYVSLSRVLIFSSHTFPGKHVPVYFILCVTIMLVFIFIYWSFSFGKLMISAYEFCTTTYLDSFTYQMILSSFHPKIMIILSPSFQLFTLSSFLFYL